MTRYQIRVRARAQRFIGAFLALVFFWVGGMAQGQAPAPQGGVTPAPKAQGDPTPTEQWRPVYHFTPAKNWTNDPNGPIWLNGTYVLYNQQNPFENKWGHMSWGHATSKDLIHWEHLPVAIPEKIDPVSRDTVWIFSGSAVWDERNTSGFCRDGGCLVAIYTAHQPDLKKESQYIAYSNDGGMSYTNYSNNPVIDLQKKDFRDPNVFWHQASQQWVMAVALPAEHKIRFYGSPNLKAWTLLSEFGPEGYIGAHWECPSLIELPVAGQPGVTRWVLMNSAAGGSLGVYMQYFVGVFDGKTFKNDNPPDQRLTVDYGDCFYAAIPWNNLPDDGKILIGWMVPGAQQTYPWRGQMSISRDLSLEKTPAGYRLLQQPATVIQKQLAGIPASRYSTISDMTLDRQDSSISKEHGLEGNSYWLDAEIELGPGAGTGFKIARSTDAAGKTLSETVIGYDPVARQLYVDKSHSNNAEHADAGKGRGKPAKLRQTIDLPDSGGKIRLEVLFDKSSLEIFVNGGEAVLTTYLFPGESETGCSVFATGGKAVIRHMQLWDLSKW